jgi:hypothetical protein
MMNFSQTLKFLTIACCAALVAACGGGGDSTPQGAASQGAASEQVLKPAEWASPAVFVTPGQSSASFALTRCDYYNWRDDDFKFLYQGKLNISSEGDISIVGAFSNEATATVSTLFTMKFAEASYVSWTVEGTVEAPVYSLLIKKIGRIPPRDRFYQGPDSEIGVNGNNSNEISITDTEKHIDITDCRLSEPLVLKSRVNPERVAANLGKGVAEIDPFFLGQTDALPNGLSEEFVFWSSYEREFGTIPQLNYRFNTKTGLLLRSVGEDSTPTSTVSFALPTNADERTGLYQESVCRFSQFYGFNEAKSIAVATSLESGDFGNLFVTRYADRWMPVISSPDFYYLFTDESTNDCLRPRSSRDEF